MYSNRILGNCDITLGDVTLREDLICLPIGDYDANLGMDWLFYHHARVECKRKLVQFCKSRENILEFWGKKIREDNCMISGVKARKLLYKNCTGYIAYLLNNPSEPGKLEEVPVVNEYLDVFPTELT
jgi:hypothetical protein